MSEYASLRQQIEQLPSKRYDCDDWLRRSDVLALLAAAPEPHVYSTEAPFIGMWREAPSTLAVGCAYCGLPYADFGMDTHVARAQWLAIHPAVHGVVCANCIMQRAVQALPGASVAHVIFEVGPKGDR